MWQVRSPPNWYQASRSHEKQVVSLLGRHNPPFDRNRPNLARWRLRLRDRREALDSSEVPAEDGNGGRRGSRGCLRSGGADLRAHLEMPVRSEAGFRLIELLLDPKARGSFRTGRVVTTPSASLVPNCTWTTRVGATSRSEVERVQPGAHFRIGSGKGRVSGGEPGASGFRGGYGEGLSHSCHSAVFA